MHELLSRKTNEPNTQRQTSIADLPMQTLTSVSEGAMAIVRCVSDNPDAPRLRELGFASGKCLRVLRNADPLVCQLGDTRIGLGRRLARCIFVGVPITSIS